MKDLEDWAASFGLLNHPNVRTRLLELNASLPSSSSSIHISTNTNSDHVCQNCFKLFSRERDLKRHLLTHTEQSQHVCGVCDRRYARKDALKRHQGSCKVENILYLFIIFFFFFFFNLLVFKINITFFHLCFQVGRPDINKQSQMDKHRSLTGV